MQSELFTVDLYNCLISKWSLVDFWSEFLANGRIKKETGDRLNPGRFLTHAGSITCMDTNSVQLIMPHGDKGRFLVLIFTPPFSSTKLV